MEAALLAELLASAGVTALSGTRINWKRRVQGEAVPAVVLHLIDGFADIHHGGPSGLVEGRVQVDCWARSYAAALALGRAIQAAVTARRFTRDGIRFDVILCVNERDGIADEASETLFLFSLDLMVHHAAAS